MGMSFGHNRDFGPVGVGPAASPLPGLGVANEIVRRDFVDSAFWSAKWIGTGGSLQLPENGQPQENTLDDEWSRRMPRHRQWVVRALTWPLRRRYPRSQPG
jgi:hypothetical protein